MYNARRIELEVAFMFYAPVGSVIRDRHKQLEVHQVMSQAVKVDMAQSCFVLDPERCAYGITIRSSSGITRPGSL